MNGGRENERENQREKERVTISEVLMRELRGSALSDTELRAAH